MSVQHIWDELQIDPMKKPFQLVKHYDEVSDKHKSFPLLGQVKKDGVFAAVLTRGYTAGIYGRTGKKLSNVNLQELDFFQCVLQGDLGQLPQGVFIAELVSDECSLEVLSGIVNPNRTKPLTEEQQAIIKNAYLCFHDFITVSEFVTGRCPYGYLTRVARMKQFIPEKDIIQSYVVKDEEELRNFADICIQAGEEGAVFKFPNADYEAGHKGWRSMKVVRGVEYDLECIGWEEGKGKYEGKVANLFFRYKDGNEIKAMLGKGWTHEDAECMFDAIHGKFYRSDKVFGSPIGKVFTVKALQESSTGKSLRLAKVGELRHDKDKGDF